MIPGTFKETFEAIIREDDIQILEKIIPHLGELVNLFQPALEAESAEEGSKDREKDREREEALKSKWKENLKAKEFNNGSREFDTDKSSPVNQYFFLELNKILEHKSLFKGEFRSEVILRRHCQHRQRPEYKVCLEAFDHFYGNNQQVNFIWL